MDEFLDISTPEGRKKFQERKEKEKEMLPEIEEMRGPIKNLLTQLRPHLEKGEYSLLISDDASGRIPALVFLDVINRIYRDRGFSPIRFFPIAPTMPKGNEEDPEVGELIDIKIANMKHVVHEVLASMEKRPEHIKPLIVTQVVYRGRALHSLRNVLRQEGIVEKPDVATIGITEQGKQQKDFLEKFSVDHFFIGSDTVGVDGIPSISDQDELSGVQQKSPHISPFAKPIARDDSRITEIRNPRRAREDVRKLADELYEWYKKV